MLSASEANNLSIKNSNNEVKTHLDFFERCIINKAECGLKELILPHWPIFNGRPSSESVFNDTLSALEGLGYEVQFFPDPIPSPNSKIYIRW